MSRKRRNWTIVAVLAAAFGGVAVATHAALDQDNPPAKSASAEKPAVENDKSAAAKAAAKQTAVAVTVAPVKLQPIQRTVEVVGTFTGQEEVLVTPQVEGRVVKVLHDMGDVVRTGDVLLEIDPTDYELALEEARKDTQSELAKVGLTEEPAGDFDVNRVPTVVRARNVEQNAARKLARAERLFKQKIIPQEELDQNETDYRVASATLQQMIMDAQAALAKARFRGAVARTAEQRLRDTRVLVPAPNEAALGKDEKAEYSVDKRMISEGEMARRTIATGVFKLVIDQTLKFLGNVPERYVGEVKKGQTVQLQVEAYPDRVFEGTITRVSPTVDRVNRTFQIEARVPNQNRDLKAGGFAKAAVLTRVDPQAKTVPVEAIITVVGVTKVFVVDSGKARAVVVTPGVSGRGWVEVLGPLDPQSQVITSGHNLLAEGTPVTVRAPEEKVTKQP